MLDASAGVCPHCGADTSWWLLRQGEVWGPYDLDTVRFIIADGRARIEDLAMIGRVGQWRRLAELLAEVSQRPVDIPAPATPVEPSGQADTSTEYRTWSVTGWLAYVGAFALACVGVFAAVVWPAYSTLSEQRAQAHARTCLEQVSLALQLYVTHNDGYLPPTGRWEQGIAIYLPEPTQYRLPARGEGEPLWYNESLAGNASEHLEDRSRLILAAICDPYDDHPPRLRGCEHQYFLYADWTVSDKPPPARDRSP